MTSTTPYALGVSLHTIDQAQTLDTMRLLKGSTVKHLELWEPTFGKDDAFIREARQVLGDAGVVPRTVHTNFGAKIDISSPDAAVRAAGLEVMRVGLDLAARVGAQYIIVHPSAEPITDDQRPARLSASRDSLAAIVELARAAGGKIAVELLPRTCLGNTAAELLALLEGLDPAVAGACLDTNHLMAAYAALPEAVRTLGPKLWALHCSDYDGLDEKHWPPLRGVIDWAAFVAALREVGFAGPLNHEAKLDGDTPAERLRFLETNYQALLQAVDQDA